MERHPVPWPAYARWAPSGMIALAVGYDWLTPEEYTGSPLLAVACVAAGATLSLSACAALAVVAVLACCGLSIAHGSFWQVRGMTEVGNVFLAAVIGVGVNRLIARCGRDLEVVRTVAETAQRAVLPEPPHRLGPLAVAARYQAAHTEARVGGDAYAVQETPYGIRMLIGDVRGKGLGAVGAVSVLLGAFREAAEHAPDLPALADQLENALSREAVRRDGEDRAEGFATALLGEFATEGGGTLRLLNRGHPPPYLLHGRRVRALEAGEPDVPLTMGLLAERRAAPDTFEFPPGATLLLVTDGVTEARDACGRFYDPALRLAGHGPFRRPRDVINALVADVEQWTGGTADDDMALLALTRRAEAAAGETPGVVRRRPRSPLPRR